MHSTAVNLAEGKVEASRREAGFAQKGHRGLVGKVLKQHLEAEASLPPPGRQGGQVHFR